LEIGERKRWMLGSLSRIAGFNLKSAIQNLKSELPSVRVNTASLRPEKCLAECRSGAGKRRILHGVSGV
jgi:hypothetical protein